MKAEHIINRIKDEIMAASATIEEDEENDRYAEGKRLACGVCCVDNEKVKS